MLHYVMELNASGWSALTRQAFRALYTLYYSSSRISARIVRTMEREIGAAMAATHPAINLSMAYSRIEN